MDREPDRDEEQLSQILKVSSHAIRRSILTALVQEGPTRVTELADRYAMSLNAVSKHIKLLESAGLVSRQRVGRVHLIRANLEPLQEIEKWSRSLRSIWELRLEQLAAILTEENDMQELSLRVSRLINAPIEEVYGAWLDPDLLTKFMIAGEGMSVPRAETDPREGGRFTIIMAAGDTELVHRGEYRKLTPYSQIIFTWESPYSVDNSTVTLNFSEAAGGTQVELEHIKFVNEESRDNHAQGWTSILAQLDTTLTGTVPSA